MSRAKRLQALARLVEQSIRPARRHRRGSRDADGRFLRPGGGDDIGVLAEIASGRAGVYADAAVLIEVHSASFSSLRLHFRDIGRRSFQHFGYPRCVAGHCFLRRHGIHALPFPGNALAGGKGLTAEAEVIA